VTAAGVLAGLWPTLSKFLLRIGRWLLDVVLEEGRTGLAVYMRMRVRVLKRRRARFRKTRPRHKWLTTRITWWAKAAKWLEGQEAKRLSRRVAEEAQKRAARELDGAEPEWENFGRWTKGQERRAKRRARRIMRRAPA
jgi:hypothetical protein